MTSYSLQPAVDQARACLSKQKSLVTRVEERWRDRRELRFRRDFTAPLLEASSRYVDEATRIADDLAAQLRLLEG